MRVDDMPFGREMDALVAEKVMGWDRYVMGCLGAPIGTKEHEIQCHRWATAWDSNGNPEFLSNYSTDIAAAWEVVEKMEMWVVPAHDSQGDRAGWNACPYGDYSKYGATNANTAPLAICRAALKAMGVEEA